MTFRAHGDPKKLEEGAAPNPEGMCAIAERAKECGLIAHRHDTEEGRIMVLDEWPDPESLRRFFEAMRPEIEPLMQEVGVTEEPEITFWRQLESHGDVDWGA